MSIIGNAILLSAASNLPYLCFEGSIDAKVKLVAEGTPSYTPTLEYSHNGFTWQSFTPGVTEVQFTYTNTKVYLRGNNDYFNYVTDDELTTNYWHFSFGTTANDIIASGNIMSLLDKTCASKTIPCSGCFALLFNGCFALKQAPELPATTLKTLCYYNMFSGTGLRSLPELPALQLAEACYYGMFSSFISVSQQEAGSASIVLPATSLVRGCYYQMFNYNYLIGECEIKATQMAEVSCYQMFMFAQNFHKMKSHITQWPSSDLSATTAWLGVVANSGTFTCKAALPKTRGVSNIPDNWTIQTF